MIPIGFFVNIQRIMSKIIKSRNAIQFAFSFAALYVHILLCPIILVISLPVNMVTIIVGMYVSDNLHAGFAYKDNFLVKPKNQDMYHKCLASMTRKLVKAGQDPNKCSLSAFNGLLFEKMSVMHDLKQILYGITDIHSRCSGLFIIGPTGK